MTLCKIESVAFGGDGISRCNGLVIFTPFTLPEEIVTVAIHKNKKNFAKASLKELIEKSPYRVTPPCSYFSRCGGCQLQHTSYPYQLELKKKFVEDSLIRIGKISFPVPSVIGSHDPFAYRRHISLKIQKIKNKWQCCFASTEGDALPIQSCILFHSPHDLILKEIQNKIAEIELPSSCEGRIKLIKVTGGYVAAFSFKNPLSIKSENQLLSLTSFHSIKGVYLETSEKKTQKGNLSLTFTCLNLNFNYSPFSFVQNHQEQSEKIYALVVLLMSSSKKVLDLYCGIGVSSLLLAQAGKEVIGIEINPHAIDMAKENTIKNNLSTVRFFCSAVENSSEKFIKEFFPDSVLVNPPRTGLDPIVRESLCLPSIRQIVYVSCHPPTLARDLDFLQKEGFSLDMLQSFDMFPQTTHVETVVKLTR